MRSRLLLLSVLLSAASSTAFAQPATYVVNPSRVQFTASADHAVMLPDGTPMVSRYELRVYAQGATEPVTTTDLGKPATVAGDITTDITSVLGSLPLSATVQYVARVVAVGQTGVGVSDPSNPFGHVGSPATPQNARVSR